MGNETYSVTIRSNISGQMREVNVTSNNGVKGAIDQAARQFPGNAVLNVVKK